MVAQNGYVADRYLKLDDNEGNTPLTMCLNHELRTGRIARTVTVNGARADQNLAS